MTKVVDLFLTPDVMVLPIEHGPIGVTLRLRAGDMAEPGWLLRAIKAQTGHSAAVQVLDESGNVVAFVLCPASTVALAEQECVVP